MGTALAISDKSFSFSASKRKARDYSIKNALAALVRQRFNGQNLVKACMAEWDLTDGQARGLVYAQGSLSTYDAMLDHKNGGFGLYLEVGMLRMQTDLEAYVADRENEATRRIQRAAADRATYGALQSRLERLKGTEEVVERAGEGRL